MSPEGTPWKVLWIELGARAMSGDAAAARRLFRDTQLCEDAISARKEASIALDPNNNVAANAGQRDQVLANLQKSLELGARICADVTEEDLSSIIYPIVLSAANSGDERAAECYVAAYYEPSDDMRSGVGLEDYRNNALRLAEEGVQRGSWQMVSLLKIAYGSSRRQSLLYSIVEPDPAKAYAYAYLEWLGMPAESGAPLNEMLEGMRSSGEISPETRAASEAWARSTFSRNFGAHKNTGNDGLCFSGR
jgi:hypothetical protein